MVTKNEWMHKPKLIVNATNLKSFSIELSFIRNLKPVQPMLVIWTIMSIIGIRTLKGYLRNSELVTVIQDPHQRLSRLELIIWVM